jgi:hypothetical protein
MPSVPTSIIASASNGLKEIVTLLSSIQESMIKHHHLKDKTAYIAYIEGKLCSAQYPCHNIHAI